MQTVLYLCGFDLHFSESTFSSAKVLASHSHKHICCINSIDYGGVRVKDASKNYTYSKEEINDLDVCLLKGKHYL